MVRVNNFQRFYSDPSARVLADRSAIVQVIGGCPKDDAGNRIWTVRGVPYVVRYSNDNFEPSGFYTVRLER